MHQMRSLLLTALIGGAMLVPGPAFAEPAGKKKKLADPNEVVCRKEEVLGSRLRATKVCKTRAEWAEEMRENRGNIERAQVQRGAIGN